MKDLSDSLLFRRHQNAARFYIESGEHGAIRSMARELAADVRLARGSEPEELLRAAGFAVHTRRSGAAGGHQQASVELVRAKLAVICDPDPAPDESWQLRVGPISPTLGGIRRKRLAHELGHIVLNSWGAHDSPRRGSDCVREEEFCDAFATELLLGGELMPEPPLLTVWASAHNVDPLTAADYWASRMGGSVCLGVSLSGNRWSRTFGVGFVGSELRQLQEGVGRPSTGRSPAGAAPFLAWTRDGMVQIEHLSTVDAAAA